MSADAIAHVREIEPGRWETHRLEDHLYGVARLAGEFAGTFGNSDWAYLAGLWHDLGKYSKEFQAYIKTATGYDPEAHLEGRKGRVDHSTAGAIHAIQRFKAGRVLAYIVAGHHAGLPDWENADAGRAQLSQRIMQEELLKRVLSEAPAAILTHPVPSSKPPAGSSPALWIRMLFSCLVDADFLDTEAFMNPTRSRERSRYPDLSALAPLLERHLENICQKSPKSKVNEIRAEILGWCRESADGDPGIYSLTVPTGGGKTLSSMAFAVRHADRNKKRRIVYVIPYTSIIEQTAEVLRGIFGDCVVEHQSNLDPELETVTSRLASENWDAPIIVTTNVQFFESLFAARPSRARKLHRLVDSVVILDEAQLIPAEFLKPIVAAMEQLASSYGLTFVLSTATQPALSAADGNAGFKGLQEVKEIVPDPADLYKRMKRTSVVLPEDTSKSVEPEQLAARVAEYDQVLCIVNTRDECRALHALLPEGSMHLSGYMCGEHRSRVINEIKVKLKRGESVRVVSTQLVEAGVDLDFPVVFRALSGLDSIAQAAGRCNREGMLANGKVFVFIPWKPTPRGHLRHMESACREILGAARDDILSPECFRDYFRHLYWIKGMDLDKERIDDHLKADQGLAIRFREAATKFRIIDESKHQPVLVRYGNGAELINLLKAGGPDRWLLRKLQRFCVSVPRSTFLQLVSEGEVVEIHEGFFAQAFEHLYDLKTGFLGDGGELVDPASLVV